MPLKNGSAHGPSLPSASAEERVVGGAVLTAVRLKQLVPHLEDRPDGASSELGPKGALAMAVHVAPTNPNPVISEYSGRKASRTSTRPRYWDHV